MRKIAIIGAGIAGLTAANRLKDFADITVFEKARGVSGRMSTRYADPYFFDHGAQYFTVKTPEFASFIEPMLSQDIIKRWNANFVEIKDRQIISRKKWDDDFSHYIGCPNMNAMPQFLAKGLDIRLNTRITLVTKVADKWQLFDSNDTLLGEYDWVIYTIPIDQLKELLPTTTDFYSKIKDPKMSACLSLMLGFEGSLNLDFDAALINDDTISWISVNSSKPNRNTSDCLVVHSSNEWADIHIDNDRELSKQQMLSKVKSLIEIENPSHITLHAWRFANIQKQKSEPFFVDNDQQLSACGDWCIQGRVESAFISAFKLAQHIIGVINE